jgi:hypothetical protein
MPKVAFKWLVIAAVITGFNASGWAQDVDAGKTGISIQLRAMPWCGWQGKRICQRGAQDAAFRLDNAR